MVGTTLDGQLNAAPRRPAGVRFAVATEADEAGIRQLLRMHPLRGAISVSFEREPDYFAGAGIGGAHDETIVAYEGPELICMGRCSTRPCWVNGRERRVGYLGELRLAACAQGRFDVLRGGYRFFRQLHVTQPAELYFTSIAADNHRARQLLERGLPGLPRYEFVAELTTLLIATDAPRRSRGRALEPATAAELADFFNQVNSRHALGAVWSAERLRSLATHDLPLSEFGVIRERGEIVAAAALWDQRRFRQTVIRGYSSSLARLRPMLNLLAPVFSQTRLPAPGAVLAQACASPLAVAPGQDDLLVPLIDELRVRAAERGIEYLAVLPTSVRAPSHPPPTHSPAARLRDAFRCRNYVTRLYQVCWPGDAGVALDNRPVNPDLGFL